MNNTTEKLGLRILEQAEEIKDLRQQLSHRESEVAALRSEISFVVEQAELRHKHIHASEDPMIKYLCERIGYGAVMDSASRQWMDKEPKSGVFIQACYGLFKISLDKTQTTAEAHDAKVWNEAIRQAIKKADTYDGVCLAYNSCSHQIGTKIESLLKPESEASGG